MQEDNAIPRTSTSVQRTFTPEVSGSYERVNHLLTFGLDILWRRRAARRAAGQGGTQWVDMCTGTGEMAANLQRLAPEGTSVHAVDFSSAMLEQARRKPEARDIHFVESDVKTLDFPDESFDLVTISFATRNISLDREILGRTFAEFHRVLRPGGLFVNLETSQPSSSLIRRLFHGYVKLMVKPLGGRISGSQKAYAYLSHTIPRFYPAGELSAILRDAGFAGVSHESLFLGIAAIHRATKA